MKALTAAEMFGALTHWAEEAKRKSPSAPPSLKPILLPLSNELTRSISKAALTKFNHKRIVAFDIRGQGQVGVKTRHALPVHFAILRALEIAPGMKLYLQDDAHKARDKIKGQLREDSDLIYHLTLEWLGAEGKNKRAKVDRILFNAPPNASIHERRTGDHHFIIPSNFVLLRIRKAEDLMTQESFLRSIAVAPRSPSKRADFSNDEFINLLGDLFALADKWHWGELVDRTNEDQEQYYRGDRV